MPRYWIVLPPGSPQLFEALQKACRTRPGWGVLIERRSGQVGQGNGPERRKATVFVGDEMKIEVEGDE